MDLILSCSPGDPARDLGQICAFILADRPSFTPGKLAAAWFNSALRCLNNLPVSRIRKRSSGNWSVWERSAGRKQLH